MRHGRVRASAHSEPLESKLERQEARLPTLPRIRSSGSDAPELAILERSHRALGLDGKSLDGKVQYRIVEEEQPDAAFFRTLVDKGRVVVVLNSRHPFYRKYYRRAMRGDTLDASEVGTVLQALLLAAGRAEAMESRRANRRVVQNFREHWGRVLGLLVDA